MKSKIDSTVEHNGVTDALSESGSRKVEPGAPILEGHTDGQVTPFLCASHKDISDSSGLLECSPDPKDIRSGRSGLSDPVKMLAFRMDAATLGRLPGSKKSGQRRQLTTRSNASFFCKAAMNAAGPLT